MSANESIYSFTVEKFTLGLSSIVGVTAVANQKGVHLNWISGAPFFGGTALAVGGAQGALVTAATNTTGAMDQMRGQFFLTAVGTTGVVDVVRLIGPSV